MKWFVRCHLGYEEKIVAHSFSYPSFSLSFYLSLSTLSLFTKIEEVRKEVGARAAVTCSAKANRGVKEVFTTALEQYFKESTSGTSSGCCSIL